MGAAVPASSGVGVAAAGQLAAGQLQGYLLLALQQQMRHASHQQQQQQQMPLLQTGPLHVSGSVAGVAGAASAGALAAAAAAPSGSEMQQQQCMPMQLQMAQQLQQAQLLQLQLLAAQQQGLAGLAPGGMMLQNGGSQERVPIEALQLVCRVCSGGAHMVRT
jgi:hypothetical protein